MKSICDFNHISMDLSEDQIKELKAYYYTYYKKCWVYKKEYKRNKIINLMGNTLSIIFMSGGIISSIVTSGASLAAISTVSLIIQAYMKHKNIEKRINQCEYAYQTYEYLLNEIKEILRSGKFDDPKELYIKMQTTDDFIQDNSPLVDHWFKKFDKEFKY